MNKQKLIIKLKQFLSQSCILCNSIARMYKQRTCKHKNQIQLGKQGHLHFSHCQDCDKLLHFTRRDK